MRRQIARCAVVDLSAAGWDQARIAIALGCSKRTVRAYLAEARSLREQAGSLALPDVDEAETGQE
jgi:transposase